MSGNINVAITGTTSITLPPGIEQGNVQYTLHCQSDSTVPDSVQSVGVGTNVTFDNVAIGTYVLYVQNLDTTGAPLSGAAQVTSNSLTLVTEATVTIITAVSISQA